MYYYAHTHKSIYICIYIYQYMEICRYIYAYINEYTHIYIYTYTYKHTYINIQYVGSNAYSNIYLMEAAISAGVAAVYTYMYI